MSLTQSIAASILLQFDNDHPEPPVALPNAFGAGFRDSAHISNTRYSNHRRAPGVLHMLSAARMNDGQFETQIPGFVLTITARIF
jgi:hypothetical protein